MLRIILWKIGFEWAHLLRVLFARPKRKVYYFAFGANLSPKVLKGRRIKVYDAFDYVLHDAALRFSQRGFFKDQAYASADPAKGEVVYGKMYLIGERDAARMDYFEGLPFLKVHHKVFRHSDGLDFFYYCARTPQQGLKPTQEYLDYLTNAYKAMPCVPKSYLETFLKIDVLDKLLPQNQTGKYIRDINQWPTFLHSLLVRYESWCLRVVYCLWNQSFFQWLIKP